MSMSEKGKLLLLKQLDAMSKGEDTKTTRMLRDDELDAVSGGLMLMHGDFASFSTN